MSTLSDIEDREKYRNKEKRLKYRFLFLLLVALLAQNPFNDTFWNDLYIAFNIMLTLLLLIGFLVLNSKMNKYHEQDYQPHQTAVICFTIVEGLNLQIDNISYFVSYSNIDFDIINT